MGFKRIKEFYDNYYRQLLIEKKKTVWSTKVGLFGTYASEVYYELFKEIELKKYNSVIDLGSGDGKVVFIASLFTKAFGVEFDTELFLRSLEIKKELSMNCEIVKSNFLDIDISNYELIFINPDKSFHEFEEFLIKNLKSKLLVCNDIFLPRFLKKEKVYWIDQIPFFLYGKE